MLAAALVSRNCISTHQKATRRQLLMQDSSRCCTCHVYTSGRHTTKPCEQTMRMSHSHFNIMSLMPCLHAPAAPAGMQHIHKTAIIIMKSHIYWLYSHCSPALRGYLQSIQRNLAIAGFAQFDNGQIVGACVRYTYYA